MVKNTIIKSTVFLGLITALLLAGFPAPQPAEAAAVKYYLPYAKGSTAAMTQGPGGTISHNKTSTMHAYDFVLAAGQKNVLASAPGTVLKKVTHVTSQKKSGDPDSYGNYVIVKHDDNTCTRYAHLAYGTVTGLANNAKVQQGAVLGTEGNTGYTFSTHELDGKGHHLHFQRQNCTTGSSISVDFVEDNWTSKNDPAGISQSFNGINKSLKFLGTSTLAPGKVMYPGQFIMSGNAKAYLVLQGDGNLVLYGPENKVLWNAGTQNKGVKRAVMQGDGNFVLYTATGKPVWHTRTNRNNGAKLVLQSDGNIVIYSKTGVAKWSSRTNGKISTSPSIVATSTLNGGQTLYLGQAIRSADKRFILTLQKDGNLVLYGPAYHVLWNSGTNNDGVVRAVMQGDGNLVAYRGDGSGAAWHTHTNGHNGSRLVLQNDGNLVIYNTSGSAVWHTHTNGQL